MLVLQLLENGKFDSYFVYVLDVISGNYQLEVFPCHEDLNFHIRVGDIFLKKSINILRQSCLVEMGYVDLVPH